MLLKHKIGNRLASLNMTYRELAKATGIHVNTIGRAVNRPDEVSLDLLLEMLRTLNVDFLYSDKYIIVEIKRINNV